MKLLFIYNANSGNLNALLDVGHKLLSPSTYPCSLCTLTYDTFTENITWKNFREQSNLEMVFYHKDEFEAIYPNVKIKYPSILKLEDNQISILLNNEKLNIIESVSELIETISDRF
ncbi:GTPase [Winogradskyella sp. A2]|uniref:GTPase n=1 Tax=Winogradskyella sp. A2 TaxID=3366944 RepID=UPI00398C7901